MQVITEDQWDTEVTDSSLPVMVDVYSDTCAPCKALARVLEQLAPQYDGKVKIVKLDAIASPNIAQEFSLSSVPTLLFFKGGTLVNKHVGFAKDSKLKELLDQLV